MRHFVGHAWALCDGCCRRHGWCKPIDTGGDLCPVAISWDCRVDFQLLGYLKCHVWQSALLVMADSNCTQLHPSSWNVFGRRKKEQQRPHMRLLVPSRRNDMWIRRFKTTWAIGCGAVEHRHLYKVALLERTLACAPSRLHRDARKLESQLAPTQKLCTD